MKTPTSLTDEEGAEKVMAKRNRIREMTFVELRTNLRARTSARVRMAIVEELGRRFGMLRRLRMKG